MTISSTNKTWDNEISFPKEIPWNLPHSFAHNKALPSPSIITRERSGARRQPCLNPLPYLKKDGAAPILRVMQYA